MKKIMKKIGRGDCIKKIGYYCSIIGVILPIILPIIYLGIEWNKEKSYSKYYMIPQGQINIELSKGYYIMLLMIATIMLTYIILYSHFIYREIKKKKTRVDCLLNIFSILVIMPIIVMFIIFICLFFYKEDVSTNRQYEIGYLKNGESKAILPIYNSRNYLVVNYEVKEKKDSKKKIIILKTKDYNFVNVEEMVKINNFIFNCVEIEGQKKQNCTDDKDYK
jgi:magnesium-transporting ATPase (P-type)